MNLFAKLKRQGVAKLLLRLLIAIYLISGLVLWSTQNVGGFVAGLMLLGGAALIYLGLALLQQLMRVRELLTYLLLNKQPQEGLSEETTLTEHPTAAVYTSGLRRRT